MAGYGSAATYEFSEGENLTIRDVARYARLWGIISLVSGVLMLLVGLGVSAMGGAIAAANMRGSTGGSGLLTSPGAIAALGAALVPTALVSVIGGLFYLRSGKALQNVVDTQGNDIPLLEDALRALVLAFKIEAIAMAVGFVVGLVIGVVGQASGGH